MEYTFPATTVDEIKRILRTLGFDDAKDFAGENSKPPPCVFLTPSGASKAFAQDQMLRDNGLQFFVGDAGVLPSVGFSQETRRKMIKAFQRQLKPKK
jgi:hypothetical protein